MDMRTVIMPKLGGIARASRRARTFEWRLEERSAGAARRAVRETLTAWGVVEGDIYTAVLLTSEVVTNAVRHVRAELQGGLVWVRVCVTDGLLRVNVTDPEPGLPRHLVAVDTDEGHRGMAVVAGYADRWGWHPAPEGGKTVWWTQVLEGREMPIFRRVLKMR
ncbi:anti-sigma regulatory factor (Ser/Thr protein kinase) [Actinomadura pelletieri DSM 43383]|uniref:Anti-sigma regulatory factor (Ser/Thr protein kinase) n=1 Tax=Actinomadura pelletieri DSM 43383 TaxID=1120940 RepID=A0A495QTV9_9ACTN|nr:ATP-binding protein [Actinomadura pelletieri]RKS76861.1 anti-sigma regulatory factor (Ser/Thr protein kinase) [Actinomadura pelletieri DSM 43383]